MSASHGNTLTSVAWTFPVLSSVGNTSIPLGY